MKVAQEEWSRVCQVRYVIDNLTIDKAAQVLEIMGFSGPAVEAYIRVRVTGIPDAWTR